MDVRYTEMIAGHMNDNGAVIALLFCGVDDDMKDTLSEALMLAAAAAALQNEASQTKLLISQPIPAEAGKGVQLQVASELKMPSRERMKA